MMILTRKCVSLRLQKISLSAIQQQTQQFRGESSCSSLVFNEFGEPIKVIQLIKGNIPQPSPDSSDILVKMLAAPVNPADINTIQGTYPVKPQFPAVGGGEGVGEVIATSSKVKNISVGDRVIPGFPGLGTWRSHAIYSEDQIIKISKDINLAEACSLTVNPCTAYRMLKDFHQVQPGDTVIQNGANSACGQLVIQICKAWNVNTVNIVRDRQDIDKLKEYLTKLGATHVLTEEEVRRTDVFKTDLKKPKLALNCVGGKNALEILRRLDHSGTMVTYGGMSRDPVTVPTSAFIFKNIKLAGFWMTQWTKDNLKNPERNQMYDELVQLITDKKLQAPLHTFVKYEQYKEALLNTASVQGFAGKKFILDFTS